ncbi:hypothetical protein [Caballeronia udeis]|uniref:hypothetical protein n=1 Tax=Caballeronia udeis TaxID=1232866 RepID=UPI0012E80E65|nr:hypothetical protein [Caballeronia udeis]
MVFSSEMRVNEWRHCSAALSFRCAARIARRILNLSYVGYDEASEWMSVRIVSLGANVLAIGSPGSISHRGILELFFLNALKMGKVRHI